MIIKKKIISSWTRYKSIKCKVFFPECEKEIIEAIKNNKSILPYGNLRSYNDVCFNRNLINLKKFNKIINFNSKLGIIIVQSGCLLSDLLKTTLQQNWFVSVSPGTKFVTIGGMIANNIHGKRISKNFFSDHLISLKIIKTTGKTVECSKTKNSDLFYSTLGGIGLTGIIIEAKIKLKKIYNEKIEVYRNFYSSYEFLNSKISSPKYEYNIAWLNSFKSNGKVRCVEFFANHSKNLNNNIQLSFLNKLKKINFIFKLIFGLINNFYLYRFISFGFFLINKLKSNNIEHLNDFFYAQDKYIDWPKLYGKRGFFQFHILVPQKYVIKFLDNFYTFCESKKVYANLIVAKKFNVKRNPMKFSDNGISLSFDFLNNSKNFLITNFFLKNKKKFNYSFNFSKNLFFEKKHIEYDQSYLKYKKKINYYNKANKFNSFFSNRIGITK